MKTIKRSTAFKKDFKRELKGRHSSYLNDQFPNILAKLAADIPLEDKYRDHELIGNWHGSRECHLKPDLLLIYENNPELLHLVRLGSHSKLFKS